MTAAVSTIVWPTPTGRPSRAPLLTRHPGRNRKCEPSPWIGCPVCGVVTLETHLGGRVIRVLDTASGHDDGARCQNHARSVEDRADETKRALGIALYRKAGPYRFGRGDAVAIDDTAQGTE